MQERENKCHISNGKTCVVLDSFLAVSCIDVKVSKSCNSYECEEHVDYDVPDVCKSDVDEDADWKRNKAYDIYQRIEFYSEQFLFFSSSVLLHLLATIPSKRSHTPATIRQQKA